LTKGYNKSNLTCSGAASWKEVRMVPLLLVLALTVDLAMGEKAVRIIRADRRLSERLWDNDFIILRLFGVLGLPLALYCRNQLRAA